jgi:hypothetical protein
VDLHRNWTEPIGAPAGSNEKARQPMQSSAIEVTLGAALTLGHNQPAAPLLSSQQTAMISIGRHCERLDYAALGDPPPGTSSDHPLQFGF